MIMGQRTINIETADISIRKIERVNWLITGAMSISAFLCFNILVAKSILIGGTVANISFFLMKRDIVKLMQGSLKLVKLTFLLKYYARLTALGLTLYLIAKYTQIHFGSLLIGLSSVAISICGTGVYQSSFIHGLKKNNMPIASE